MRKWWGAIGVIFLLGLISAPIPAPAQISALPVAPCVTISSIVNGVTQYFCEPVGPSYPLPVVISPSPASPGTFLPSNITIGTTDGVIAGTAAMTSYFDLQNESSSATICINFNTAAQISGSSCTAGWTLPPLWHVSWPMAGASLLPPGPVHAIASAASTLAFLGVK